MVTGMKVYCAIYEASTQLKVSPNSLIAMVQDYRVHGNVKSYKPYHRKKDFFERLRPDQLQLFRMIIHDMFKKINAKKKDKTAPGLETVPTVRSIFKIISEEYSEQFPNFTERKVWVTMQRLGFRYKKHPQTKNVLLIGRYICHENSTSFMSLMVDFVYDFLLFSCLLFSINRLRF